MLCTASGRSVEARPVAAMTWSWRTSVTVIPKAHKTPASRGITKPSPRPDPGQRGRVQATGPAPTAARSDADRGPARSRRPGSRRHVRIDYPNDAGGRLEPSSPSGSATGGRLPRAPGRHGDRAGLRGMLRRQVAEHDVRVGDGRLGRRVRKRPARARIRHCEARRAGHHRRRLRRSSRRRRRSSGRPRPRRRWAAARPACRATARRAAWIMHTSKLVPPMSTVIRSSQTDVRARCRPPRVRPRGRSAGRSPAGAGCPGSGAAAVDLHDQRSARARSASCARGVRYSLIPGRCRRSDRGRGPLPLADLGQDVRRADDLAPGSSSARISAARRSCVRVDDRPQAAPPRPPSRRGRRRCCGRGTDLARRAA